MHRLMCKQSSLNGVPRKPVLNGVLSCGLTSFITNPLMNASFFGSNGAPVDILSVLMNIFRNMPKWCAL